MGWGSTALLTGKGLRPNKAHVAAQNIEKSWKLVDATAPQTCGKPFVFRDCAKLIGDKDLAAKTNQLLLRDDWASDDNAERCGHNEQRGRKQHYRHECKRDIHGSLDRSAQRASRSPTPRRYCTFVAGSFEAFLRTL
jgi:hypothetical protein